MIKFLLHLLFLSLLCVGLSRCKHEPPPEPPAVCQYDSSIEEMKKWYYFKTGTWWVYQEQNTGAFDTITVYHDWAGINTDGFEGFEWFATSSYDDSFLFYTFNTSFTIHCLTHENCQCHKLDRERAQIGNYIGSGQIFLYPLIEGNYSYLISGNGQTGGQTQLAEVTDSKIIGGVEFIDVIQWQVYPDGSENDETSVYFLAKFNGIIRHEILEQNQVWNLIDSNIIQ
jgi:hypothetical protein